MPDERSRVLVINPGSTSTKVGVYRRDGAELVRTIEHEDGELAGSGGLLRWRSLSSAPN